MPPGVSRSAVKPPRAARRKLAASAPVAKRSLKDVATVNHQGTVIAVARDAAPGATALYYNVLDLKVTTLRDGQEWTGFNKLDFPSELRPAGLGIVTVGNVKGAVLPAADAPFKIVSDQRYVCVFQQSADNTLLLNRFMLKRLANPRGGEPIPILEPVWEVRFQRSGKQDVPNGPRDSQSYLTPDGKPFIEPTIELSMIKMESGQFDAIILPGETSEKKTWQFFAVDSQTGKLNLFAFPMDDNGLFVFDLKQLKVDSNGVIEPDVSVELKLKNGSKSEPIPCAGVPSSTLYTLHERVSADNGDSLLLKRTARVLVSIPVNRGADGPGVATLDFALSTDGNLAQIEPITMASLVFPADNGLQFGGSAYLTLPNNNSVLSLKGPFRAEFWLYVTSLVKQDQFVFRGDQNTPPNQAAPYVKLTQSLELEVGFGDGTATVAARTASPVVTPMQWVHAQVAFDPTLASNNLTIAINGHTVPVTGGQAKTPPAGNPIITVSGNGDGIIGILDFLKIWNNSDATGSPIGNWECDKIDYNKSVPTTPDSSPNNNDASVYGAVLVPSTAPVENGNGGTMQVDKAGLTIYAGVLDFVEPKNAPFLLTGSDGLVHLYFEGPDEEFCVAQYDAESARAVFGAQWTSKTTQSTETGTVQLIAARSGSFMNQSTIAISPTEREELCEIVIDNNQGRVETWKGVPRASVQFVDVLNGASTDNLNDPQFKAGFRTFYDSHGLYAVSRLRISDNIPNMLSMLSRFPARIQLASAQVTTTAPKCEVQLTYSVRQWPTQVSISQAWLDLPFYVKDTLSALSGSLASYDYSSTISSNAAAYRLLARDGSSTFHNALIVTRPDVTGLSIQITNAQNNADSLCDATLEVTVGIVQESQSFANIPRDQAGFAEAIQSGKMAEYLLMLTDGLNAAFPNRPAGSPDLADMLAWASILDAFTATVPGALATMVTQGPVAAAILQQASYVENHRQYPLEAGSTLYRVSTDTTPANGGVGVVEDTAMFSNGVARLLTAAVNGGWITESPHKAVELDGTNAVTYDQAAASADVLAIAGDLTFETWCRPTVAGGNPTNQPRLLSYYRIGNSDFPDEPIQYGLGLRPAPCLAFGDQTTIYGSYNLSGASPECSMQIWLSPTATDAGQLLQLSTIGVVQPYVTLAVDENQRAVATYGNQLGSVTSKNSLRRDRWTQLTVTLANKDATTVTLRLYVDGVIADSADIPVGSWTKAIGSFAAGKTSGALPMSANGIFLWRRALTPNEVGLRYEMPARLNDQDLVIAWYLVEGQGNSVVNRAIEGSPIASPIINQPSTPWLPRGVYTFPYAVNRGYGLLGRESPLSGGWRHLAATYRSAFAVHLPGTDHADCGNDASLDFSSSLGIEAWCKPDQVGIVQTLVSKPGNYELGLNYDNTVVVTIWTSDGTKRVYSKTKVVAGQAYYIAATAKASPSNSKPSANPDSSLGNEPEKPKYVLDVELYVNGKLDGSFFKNDYSDPVNISTSTSHLNLGRSSAGAANFVGYLSDVRVWNRALDAGEIASTFATHLSPQENGMVSYWRFSEVRGKYAYDQNNLNNGILTSNQLWSLFPPASAFTLLVDGEAQRLVEVIDPASVGGYGVQQLTVGAQRTGASSLGMPFYGQLSEVRIWNIERTPEQISEDMYRELSGQEIGLAGYWPFDAGSGSIAEDATGHGNDGVLYPSNDPPRWVASHAPVSNEAPEVFNVLGGIQTFFLERISGIPSVVEYADTRRDAYGMLFSVMKRCYASEDGRGTVNLVTGYKLGDLDTVYAGQVQTQPSLIGFIEGAPPIPSENQTNPWWNDVNSLNSYADNSKVQLTQAEETVRGFSGSENSGSGNSIAGKVGVYLATSASLSFGLGEEVGWETWHLDGHLGYAGESKSATNAEQELGFGYGKTTTLTDELSAAGTWEPANHILNPEVGRRYVPENIGYALVKSLTADMYLVKLRGSNTVVKLTLVPDPDIPEDVNIIDFPIDPKYVKNGTLDGKVGFVNDPDYPFADLQHGSYFKPLEAYNLKRSIERQDKQLEAYYKQFDTANYSARAGLAIKDGVLSTSKNGFEKFRDDALPLGPSYDWKKRLAKRSLVNTYVWTATGGLHTEQSELVDTYTESYTRLSSYDSSDGLQFDLAVAFVAGLYCEFDALWNTSLEIVSIKKKESEISFGLDVEFSPEFYLKRPIVEDGVPIGYTEEDAPGKVDGYRFMSYFLAPSEQNFLEFQRVVDQNWLNNSSDPGAAALLTATSAANGAWRVLHRVTYVSRVPPPLQPAPSETTPPPVTPPANLDSNSVIVQLVEKQITVPNPTPAQIGQATAAVLGQSKETPGLLANVLPWWVTFLNAAQDTRSPAYQELTALRTDLLTYMEQTYATQAHTGGGGLIAMQRALPAPG